MILIEEHSLTHALLEYDNIDNDCIIRISAVIKINDKLEVIAGKISKRKNNECIGIYHLDDTVGIRCKLNDYCLYKEECVIVVSGSGPWSAFASNIDVAIDWDPSRDPNFVEDFKPAGTLLSSYGMLSSENKDFKNSLLQKSFEALFIEKMNDRNTKRKNHSPDTRIASNLVRSVSNAFHYIANRTSFQEKLKNVSLSMAMLDLRSQELEMLLSESVSLRRRQHLKYNIFMDALLGVIVAILLVIYSNQVADAAYDYVGYAMRYESMEAQAKWILQQHAPLGFKVNQQLDTMLGSMFLVVIFSWYTITAYIAPLGAMLVILASGLILCGGGLTMALAIVADSVLIVSLHVQLLHKMFARIFRLELSMISALFKLILGKKRNILRKRVDTLETTHPQYLLGTMIFVAVVFLFQTTITYYTLCVCLWLSVYFMYTLCWIAITLLKTTPVYSFLLLLSNRKLIPNHVHLRMHRYIGLPNHSFLVFHGSYLTKRHLMGAWLRVCQRELGQQYNRANLATKSFLGSIIRGLEVRLPAMPFQSSTPHKKTPE